MAGNVDRVQLQVEVVRSQLDTLIKDVNALKAQKLTLTVDSSGMDAINKFNRSMQTLTQNAQGVRSAFTKIWAGAAEDAPTRTIETINQGLGRTTEIIRTLDKETGDYTVAQTKQTANYEQMAKAAQKAAEADAKAAQQARAYLLAEQEAAQKAAAKYDPTPMQQQIEALTGISSASKSAAESASVFEKAWLDSSDKVTAANQKAAEQAQQVFSAAQERMPTIQKQYADLARSIEGATKKYKDGTFDSLKSKVAGARASIDALDADLASGKIGYDEYVKGVENARSGLKDLQNEFSQTRAGTENLKKSTNVLGDSLGNVVKKIIAWQVINASVAAVIRSFKEAVATLKEVDTELVAIQKVTNNTDAEMAKLSQHAYEVASQYGVAVTDYLQSTGAFAKAGYKELSEDMAELATKTQLVGDVNAETANQFLLSADAAYKLNGNVTALSEVLDKANVIENNYATSIQKIAEGLPNVASIASMTNVSIDELMAALGTITSVTQESGSRASYALRALLLNIMGDTKTEIEDGVSWTKEEIESLSDVLWKYSRDAMEAAQATGSIVNPMEAIAGLAQAYKEGVLTEAELAKIESDLGGKLRTNQLDALIKNYDMYSEMLDKVADSAGSADEEVSIMLSSWESKANILKNTWTELISHLVDTDMVKGALDGLTDTIEFLDSAGGRAVITVVALGGAVYGVVTAAASLKKAMVALDLTSKATTIGLIVAALAGVVAIVAGISAAIEDANKSFEELDENLKNTQSEIQTTADKLENYRQKLQELNEVEPSDRTKAWQDERLELEANIESAQLYLEALEKLERRQAKELYESDNAPVGYSASASLKNAKTGFRFKGGFHWAKGLASTVAFGDEELEEYLQNALKVYDSEEEAIYKIAEAFSEKSKYGHSLIDETAYESAMQIQNAQERLEALRTLIEDVGFSITTATESHDSVFEKISVLADKASGSVENLTASEKERAKQYVDTYAKTLPSLDLFDEKTKREAEDILALSAALSEFDMQTSTIPEKIAWVANSFGVSSAEAAALLANLGLIGGTAVQATQDIVVLGNGMYAAKSACVELEDGTWALKDALEETGDAAENTGDTLSQTLTKSLFDVSGKLTETAQQAIKTNTALADLAVAELKAQQEAAQSNYENLISQLQQVGATAYWSSTQLTAMISAAGMATSGTTAAQQSANLERTYRDLTGKTAQSDWESYNIWRAQYLSDAAQKYNKKQQEELQDRIDQILNASGQSSGSGSSGGGGSASDANLTAHQKKVSLLKSELTLMQNQGRSADLQKEKMRQIQQALHAQAQYLRSIGGSQEDINALSAEWWEWQKKINDEVANTDDLLSELQSALQDRLQDAADQRDAELAAIDEQIAALKRQKDEKDDQLKLEEKILAVQKAQADLANAQAERTIRQYNAKTGQWEWVADQKDVDDAKDALEKAEKDLEDFRDELEYNARLAELEAQKDAINAWYDRLEAQYKRLTDSLKEKTRGIGEILQDIWKNATPELKAVILENAEIFKAFGIDVKALSDAVNEAAREIYGLSASGDRYDIKSEKGQDFIKNAKPGDKMTGGDGSTWVKNRDGSVTITDKWGRVFTVDGSTGGSGGGSTDTGYGGDEDDEEDSGGGKYSGTVYAVSDDGKKYKISSAKGLNFLNTAKAGARMEAGDGSVWVKKSNGRTVITDKWGRVFTVYDQGGILRGVGGIKATEQDELVLPPDLTQIAKQRFASVKNIAPSQDAQSVRLLDGMRQMLGAEGGRGSVTNASYDNRRVGTQYNGDIYNLNGMTFTEQQVGGMTMREFVRSARTLAICKNGN
nr:MAG TPA: minor tail protein [Caudoviricetes sp.]